MRYASYTELAERARRSGLVARCAVAGAANAHALEAVYQAADQGFVRPVLIGPADRTRALLAELGLDEQRAELVDCAPEENPAAVAVRLVREGAVDFILKGGIETRDLLRPVLDKETGINDAGFVTHLGLMQIAGYPKLLAMSDAAVVPYPDLEAKAKIVRITTEALRRLGIDTPVVAALASIEVVNPKLPETVEARELQEMSERGELGDCVVVGPISYDLATSRESAAIKGYDSPYAGDVDMLLVPQMVTGNVMSKIWNADERNILAGCLVGTRVPVALTSRSASSAEKLHSLLLCSLLGASATDPTPVPAADPASEPALVPATVPSGDAGSPE
ncbi:phosphate acyltransferase [Actinotalea sp. M2MS4P-6]|uniref:phosphate acyltransferase n=1 Tax=Actinotalea sp. M2MS4P-6 TaxID=2983762 RepID=UPI0021E48308|nr:phosphate acyltransferase [Actinotalea sp. M2MS4P-6]MCV2394301.1 phosphate acyltransferase [Actinotalea sp. M2MS4P-6]